MLNGSSKLMLALGAVSSAKPQVGAILSCNKKTADRGLMLSRRQALALTEAQSDTLKKTGRIELGEGIVPKLISAFYDSPYITKENYESTLYELIDLFYSFKNETADLIADDRLIEYMKAKFNGECRGSAELLGDALIAPTRKINERRAINPFENTEITDD